MREPDVRLTESDSIKHDLPTMATTTLETPATETLNVDDLCRMPEHLYLAHAIDQIDAVFKAKSYIPVEVHGPLLELARTLCTREGYARTKVEMESGVTA